MMHWPIEPDPKIYDTRRVRRFALLPVKAFVREGFKTDFDNPVKIWMVWYWSYERYYGIDNGWEPIERIVDQTDL